MSCGINSVILLWKVAICNVTSLNSQSGAESNFSTAVLLKTNKGTISFAAT